jgi:hypothetical protein
MKNAAQARSRPDPKEAEPTQGKLGFAQAPRINRWRKSAVAKIPGQSVRERKRRSKFMD